MSLLEIQDLKKSYPLDGKEHQEVLKGINLSLDYGELVAVIGESGSGKSTLLNIIGGLDSDYQGEVFFGGTSLKHYKNHKIDDYRKLNVGFIFQSFNLIPTLTVLENIKTAAQLTNMGTKQQEEKALALVHKLGLDGMERKLPAQLSGGQKQRVSIARALMNDPDMILADEPTGALDRENAETVAHLLKEIAREGTLVVVVTHSQRIAAKCDKVVSMEYGVISSVITNTENPAHIKRGSLSKSIRPGKTSFVSAMKKAYKSIKKNKSRNLLVSLGSGIGIFAVVIMLFLSSGMESYITEQMYTSTSPVLVEAYKAKEEAQLMSAPQALLSVGEPFTQEEVEELSAVDYVADIETGSTFTQSATYTADGQDNKIILLSTIHSGYQPSLKCGTMPQNGEILISESIASTLADDIDTLVGTTLPISISYDIKGEQVSEYSAIISGVVENETMIDANITSAYMNMNTLSNIISDFGEPPITSVYLTAASEEDVDAVKNAVNDLGYSSNHQDAALDRISDMLDIVTLGLTAIAAISLVVSGIMIMVVLFISVVERTREIGTLRAIGAGKSDIRKNFISEGILLGILGGAIGVVLAVVFGHTANTILLRSMGVSLIDIDTLYIGFGILVSVMVSTCASLIPAARAANLDPVEALRYE